MEGKKGTAIAKGNWKKNEVTTKKGKIKKDVIKKYTLLNGEDKRDAQF